MNRYEVEINATFLILIEEAENEEEAQQHAFEAWQGGETGVLDWSEVGNAYAV